MNRGSEIRAGRQALLWLLRSSYVGRQALCYFVMIQGRRTGPDLYHAAFTAALFINLGVFLAAFFSYAPLGRRLVLVDSWLRPVGLLALALAAFAWTESPEFAVGWARGALPRWLLLVEFVLMPLANMRLVRGVGHRG